MFLAGLPESGECCNYAICGGPEVVICVSRVVIRISLVLAIFERATSDPTQHYPGHPSTGELTTVLRIGLHKR